MFRLTCNLIHHACLYMYVCCVSTGNLRTYDGGGPYDLSYLPVQVNEIRGAIAARKDYTDQVFMRTRTRTHAHRTHTHTYRQAQDAHTHFAIRAS